MSTRIVDCVIIHQTIDKGIDYIPKNYKILVFSAETTSHSFRLNLARAQWTQSYRTKYK